MSFWDNVKKFTQPYSDDEYEDYEDEVDQYEDEPAPRSRRTSPFAGTAAESAPAAGVSEEEVKGMIAKAMKEFAATLLAQAE